MRGTAEENARMMQCHPLYSLGPRRHAVLCVEAIELAMANGMGNRDPNIFYEHFTVEVQHVKILSGGVESEKIVGLLCHANPDIVVTGEGADTAVANLWNNYSYNP